MNQMIILRGLPGSGKSTFAETLRDGFAVVEARTVVVSANHYFMRDGKYRFDANKLPAAHGAAIQAASEAVRDRVHVVIVDNPNVRRWEFRPYVDLAREHKFDVTEIIVGRVGANAPCEEYCRRCLHDVPLSTIQKMANDFEL